MADALCTDTMIEKRYGNKSIREITFDWTSATGETVTATVSSTALFANIGQLTGWVSRVTTIPDTGGTQPSDNYTFTLKDKNGATIASGTCDTANIEDWVAGYHICESKLDLAIASAGAVKGGKVVVIVVTP